MTIFRHTASGPGSAGDVWTTTMHSSGAANLASTHTAWSTLVSSFLSGSLAAMWPNEFSITELKTDVIDTVSGRNTSQTKTAVAIPGTGAGATPSPRDCLVIGLRSALPTRSGRGRMYWPAPDATHLAANGLLNGADATSLATSFGNAVTAFRVTAQPIIWHRPKPRLLPPVAGTSDNVTYVAVSTIIGTQRRRTNRVFNAYATKTV